MCILLGIFCQFYQIFGQFDVFDILSWWTQNTQISRKTPNFIVFCCFQKTSVCLIFKLTSEKLIFHHYSKKAVLKKVADNKLQTTTHKTLNFTQKMAWNHYQNRPKITSQHIYIYTVGPLTWPQFSLFWVNNLATLEPITWPPSKKNLFHGVFRVHNFQGMAQTECLDKLCLVKIGVFRKSGVAILGGVGGASDCYCMMLLESSN